MTSLGPPKAAGLVSVATLVVVSMAESQTWPIHIFAIALFLANSWWWLGRLGPRTRIPALLAIASTAVAIGVVLSGGPGSVAGLATMLILAPAGLSVGTALSTHPHAALWASLAIAAVQWPLVALQTVEPALILEKVAANTEGLTSIQIQNVADRLRPVGSFISPGLLAVSFLVGLVLALLSLRAGASTHICMVLIAGHSFALLATGSRASIASAVIGALLVLNSKRVALLLAGGGFVAIVSGTPAASRVGLDTRIDILRQAQETLGQHWSIGVGWGETARHVATTADGTIYHLHFMPIHALFELGVLGLIGSMLACLWLFRTSPQTLMVVAPLLLLDVGVFLEPRTAVMTWALIALVRNYVSNSPTALSALADPGSTLADNVGRPIRNLAMGRSPGVRAHLPTLPTT